MSTEAELPRSLAICGGGASSVLLVNALRKRSDRPIDISIFDPGSVAGLGVAYGTQSDAHLLNVPAGRMSADAEEPDAFVRWLDVHEKGAGHTARSFVPRKVYGAYLRHLLRSAMDDRHSRVTVRIVRARVGNISPAENGWSLGLEGGSNHRADTVIVATGNEPPRRLPAAAGCSHPLLIDDAWDAAAITSVPADAHVVLVGSGLTAVDVALDLVGRGHRGRISMLSRHGLLPRVHAHAFVSGSWLFPPYPSSIADLMRRTREEAARIPGFEGWRTAIDALRPNLPAVWDALSPGDRARFLRHVRPYWEVHRHRMAPEIAVRIRDAISRGAVTIEKGRLSEITSGSDTPFNLHIRKPGATTRLDAGAVINCTGPDNNPSASSNPLLVSLLSGGLARPDALRLGIETDAKDRIVSASGQSHESLFAVGPAAKGRLWEVTAIPEIRVQAQRLARHISPPVSEQVVAYTI